jgi:hypothetical protein
LIPEQLNDPIRSNPFCLAPAILTLLLPTIAVSGAVCASLLATRGVAVTLFDSGRGAGGRMAQRRCSTD